VLPLALSLYGELLISQMGDRFVLAGYIQLIGV
jgi:hypothetical protein